MTNDGKQLDSDIIKALRANRDNDKTWNKSLSERARTSSYLESLLRYIDTPEAGYPIKDNYRNILELESEYRNILDMLKKIDTQVAEAKMVYLLPKTLALVIALISLIVCLLYIIYTTAWFLKLGRGMLVICQKLALTYSIILIPVISFAIAFFFANIGEIPVPYLLGIGRRAVNLADWSKILIVLSSLGFILSVLLRLAFDSTPLRREEFFRQHGDKIKT
jgi:hypothetical protein